MINIDEHSRLVVIGFLDHIDVYVMVSWRHWAELGVHMASSNHSSPSQNSRWSAYSLRLRCHFKIMHDDCIPYGLDFQSGALWDFLEHPKQRDRHTGLLKAHGTPCLPLCDKCMKDQYLSTLALSWWVDLIIQNKNSEIANVSWLLKGHYWHVQRHHWF